MKTSQPLDTALEEVSLFLEELAITSGLFYQSLLPIMTALRSGRSPRAAGLEEKLRPSQDFLTVVQQVLLEMEKSLAQVKNNFSGMETAEWNTTRSELEKEAAFYRQFQETSETLMQKLNLIAPEGQVSSLGRLPIDDAWEEIEKMTRKI